MSKYNRSTLSDCRVNELCVFDVDNVIVVLYSILLLEDSSYRIPPLITTCRYKRGVVISEGVVICEIYILYVIGTYAGFGLSVFLTLYDTYITTNFIVRNSI